MPHVPEAGGRAREKHEGHDRFDLSHARRPRLRAAAFALYLTRVRTAGRPEVGAVAKLLPSVEEFQEKLNTRRRRPATTAFACTTS
jgi:hypothetical protein